MSGKLVILQHNCNRSINMMQGLMESGRRADIIEIQEPWIGKTRRGKKNTEGAVDLGNREIIVGSQNFDMLYKKS